MRGTAVLQAAVIFVSSLAACSLFYAALLYLERRRASEDPFAAVKKRGLAAPGSSDPVFQAAPRDYSSESWKPSKGILVWALLFGGIPLLMVALTLAGELSGGAEWSSGWEVTGPVLTGGWPTLFTCAGLLVASPTLNKVLGVVGYTLTGEALVIRHRLGCTVIPYIMIESARLDEITVTEWRAPGGSNMIYSATDSRGGTLTLERDSWLPQLRGAPYVSRDRGGCVVVQLRGGDGVALTPVDPEGLLKALGDRVKRA